MNLKHISIDFTTEKFLVLCHFVTGKLITYIILLQWHYYYYY